MRELQIWGPILWIVSVQDVVESFLPTSETRLCVSRLRQHHTALTVRARGLDSLLSSNKLRVDSRLFFSSVGGGSASISGLEEGSSLDAEKDDEQINRRERIGTVETSTISKKRGDDAAQSTPQGNNFARNNRWLEDATDKVLNLSNFPLGSLAEADVVSFTGLMVEWSRRRSLEGAMIVERLLKRIVDDMRAGNEDVQVTTRMYIIAIDAWGKSDEVAGAERAQSIHDAMIQTYEQTKNSLIKPTSKSYNTLILAWAKSENPSALQAAEKTLRSMLTGSDATGNIRPDAATVSAMLGLYARNNSETSIAKAETLVRSMSGLQIRPNRHVYSALQEVYLRSGRKDAPKRTLSVLKMMMHEYSTGNIIARPNVSNFNNVLCAYSRTPSKNSALRAVEMLNQIEMPKEEGGYDVNPDRLSYFLAILTCSRCPNHSFGANLAEKLLRRIEERSKAEAKRREELSIAAPPLISIDIECFNVVLTALSKSRDSDAVDRIFSIISRMEEYADGGQEHLRPSTRTLNTALNALSQRKHNKAVRRAEETLDRMFQLHKSGVPNIKPDTFSYSAILKCYQRLGTPDAAQKGSDILSGMEELYERKILDSPPDTFHYTIVCSTWSISRAKNAPDECVRILSRMKEKDEEGWPNVKPNIRTYNAVLDCLSRSLQANKAEQLLYHMLSLAKDGDDSARPDAFSFNSVINAFIYSKMRDAGRRAESVLERGLEYAEEDGGKMLEIKSFTSILGYYGRQTKVIDSPYRAQYLLNRLISLFKAGFTDLSPHVSCFTNVMEAYAAQRHRDAGECSEEILRSMIKLQKNHNASNIEVNTGVMNCVLNSWSECVGHDDAGTRAEHILNLMEKKSGSGTYSMAPNYRSYNLVIRAWSRSKCSNKAEKALGILQRAKNCYLQKKANSMPPEYTYSLVIHACAFSESDDPNIEKRAFEIAVNIMDELINDVPANRTEPSSATYAWFFQVCARLRLSEGYKSCDIRRFFLRCCEKGRVNDFVLQSLKQATSDDLFAELVEEHSSSQERADLKQNVQLSNLPKSWISNDSRTRSKSKQNR